MKKWLKEKWRAHGEALDPGEVCDGMLPGERISLEALAERTGYSEFRTRGALYHLKRQGFAVKLSDGRWMKTDGTSQDETGVRDH